MTDRNRVPLLFLQAANGYWTGQPQAVLFGQMSQRAYAYGDQFAALLADSFAAHILLDLHDFVAAKVAIDEIFAAVDQHRFSALPVEDLSDREMTLLRMLPTALSQREIGAALNLSPNTIKSYNRTIYRKFGVSSRDQAVAAARAVGLLG